MKTNCNAPSLKQITFVFAIVLVCADPLRAAGQVASGASFTRMMTGAISTDRAHSFGCAWADYDNDGYLDLFLGNAFGDANALYHNERDGTFNRVTVGEIATTIGDSGGTAWGDYDNDGDLDLFIVNWQIPSFLFRNDGNGDFTRVIDGNMGSNAANANGCAWADYDRDGYLDLVVGNTDGQHEFLYRNNGDGTFTQVTSDPVVESGGNAGVLAWGDYDNDSAPDLFVSNHGPLGNRNDFLFRNRGNGSFTRILDGPVVNDEIASAGCAWGDYDSDGDLDLFVAGGEAATANRLYRNNGDASFSEVASGDILTASGTAQSCDWGDYDNDGWLDLFVANDSGQNNFLFQNNGDGSFTRVAAGRIVTDGGYSIGCAWGDYDNDGFLDLFVSNGGTQVAEAGFLYHNDRNSNNWLRLKCIGAASNRSAIGSKVRVKASISGATRWQLREITTGGGGNGSGIDPHFGLGNATNAEAIRIEWPSGAVQELRRVAVNQILTVKEPPLLAASGMDPFRESFQLTLKGGLGRTYTIEYSTNLSHWNALTNFTATALVTEVKDPNVIRSPTRFYRAAEDN